MFNSLQAGRGVAALMVIFYHLNGSIWGKAKYFSDRFFRPFGFGHAGVQFFFVLSGYIIFHVHQEDIGRSSGLLSFLRKRFVRIYPIYWIVLASILPFYFYLPGLGKGDETSLSQILTSVCLLPYPAEPILSVAWTLRHEILFYAIFSVGILSMPTGIAVMFLWQALCVSTLLITYTVGPVQFPFDFIASPNNLLFGFGMGVAALAQRPCGKVLASLTALAGVIIFVATGLHEVYSRPSPTHAVYSLLFGFGSALVVLGLVLLEQSSRLKTPSWLVALGGASYTLYLVHFPLFSLGAKAILAFGLKELVPEILLFAGLLLLVLLLSWLIHQNVERPVLSALTPRSKLAPAEAA
ncbi:acyltransferase [Bradyrhizobium sp. SSUT112]|uniref:acyltransferase family protein n=1 Tax=Bradyrhizobium sp. SSUT112 TaxID=3040604 RepID=UPI0024493EFF|nr:acyltransferase [Bradyrhizobium sp. SSUT112]MDH2357130.1 acyltransferase [Bradyrhizobium sp. SSUT112]